MHRSPAGLDLAAQELVVLARLALALNELAHQFAQHLRRRAMGGLGLGHELGAQLGLQLHRKNGLFRHDQISCHLILNKYIRFHYSVRLSDRDSTRGEMASNPREDHGVSMLALHLLQNCMAYININTLMIRKVLTQSHWQGRLTPRDYSALTPLISEHVNPFGRFDLDMNARLALLCPRWRLVTPAEFWRNFG